MKGSKGFSLIELLAVIAILAVLIAIAVPRYFEAVDEARRNAQKQNMAIIRTALEVYRHRSNKHYYPYTSTANNYTFNDFLKDPNYFTETPVCPYNNQTYSYTDKKTDLVLEKANLIYYEVNDENKPTSYTIDYYKD